MKNVLLTTTALVAFAGAAAADTSITWGGSASIGYNDEYVDGVYFDADIDITLSATSALDNGYTAEMSYGIDITGNLIALTTDGSYHPLLEGDDYPELSISNGMNSVALGDTGAASDHFSKVTGMSNGLADTDGAQVLRADAAFGAFEVSASYVLNSTDRIWGDDLSTPVVENVWYDDPLDATPFAGGDSTVADEDISFGASGSFGDFTFGVGYDLESTVYDDVLGTTSLEDNWGVDAGFSFGAATISAAYASDGIESMGVGIDYDLGNGLVVGATYATNTGEDDTYGVTADYAAGAFEVSAAYLMDNTNQEISGEASYDMGNGAVVMAGFSQQDSGLDNTNQWIAATYDLGGNASVLLAYATDDDPLATEEIGPNDYYEGITLELSMKF